MKRDTPMSKIILKNVNIILTLIQIFGSDNNKN